MTCCGVASGQNTAAQKSAGEHCFTMFSDVNGHLPTERKLVVLNDETTPTPYPPSWASRRSRSSPTSTSNPATSSPPWPPQPPPSSSGLA